MHTILALSKRSHEIARDHGFVEDGKAHPFYRDFNLFLSETAEALEDYRGGKRVDETWYELTSVRPYVDPPEKITKRYASREEYDRDPVRVVGPDGVERNASPKVCGIPSELADVIIRICQRCGTDGSAPLLDACVTEAVDPELGENFEKDLSIINKHLARADMDSDNTPLRISHLANAVRHIFAVSQKNGVDLWVIIDEKEAFNRTRPFKHGGKKL